VRPIERVTVWSRDAGRAAGLAGWLADRGLEARPAGDLARAVAEADIITCATLAAVPVLRGEWVRPGTHVDLVGSSRADAREADDALMRRARVFVDSRAGALAKAGELALPLGVDAVAGELADLCRGLRSGRAGPDEITVFKAVGTALADLAAAVLVYRGLLTPRSA
jgi:alanine dehydrogenase